MTNFWGFDSLSNAQPEGTATARAAEVSGDDCKSVRECRHGWGVLARKSLAPSGHGMHRLYTVRAKSWKHAPTKNEATARRGVRNRRKNAFRQLCGLCSFRPLPGLARPDRRGGRDRGSWSGSYRVESLLQMTGRGARTECFVSRAILVSTASTSLFPSRFQHFTISAFPSCARLAPTAVVFRAQRSGSLGVHVVMTSGDRVQSV